MGLTIARMRIRDALYRDSVPKIPTNIIPPSLSGPISVGGTVAFIPGSWIGPDTTFVYQLYLDGVPVGGATGPTYTFLEADAGKVPRLAEIPERGLTAFSQTYNPVDETPIAINPPYFVGATAAGTGDGSSVANRAAFTSLNAVIGAARAVDAVAIGVYAPSGIDLSTIISITNGGSAAFPITIIGVDASSVPTLTEIRGTRSSPWTLGQTDGSDSIRLHAGANYLDFQYLDFKNTASGIRVCADITGLSVQNCRGTNVRRWLDTLISGTGVTTAKITGLLVKDCTVKGFSKSCIRLDHGTTDFLLEDIDLDSERQDGDNFAVGVDMQNANYGVLRRVIARNGQQTRLQSQYWNSDGFLAETICHHLTFDSCEGYGFTDAGFDLKSDTTTLTYCRAAGNKWNFKMQGGRAPQVPIQMLRCTGLDPYLFGGTGRSNQVYTEFGRVIVTDCAFADSRSIADRDREEAIEPGHSTDVFRVEANGGSIIITNTSVQMGPGATLAVAAVGGMIVGAEATEAHARPTCTVDPSITSAGGWIVGQTAGGNNGTWTGDDPLTFEYGWFRTDAAGLLVPIDNSNAATHLIVDADDDHQLLRKVYTTDANGFVTEASSALSPVVVGGAPEYTSAPSHNNAHTVGSIVIGTAGVVTGSPTPTRAFQWYRFPSTAIPGATSLNYGVQGADEGFQLFLRDFADNINGSESADSELTDVVVAADSGETFFYIAPTSQGAGDGSSPANASGSLDLGLLPAAIAVSPASRHIRILSHLINGTPCEYIRMGAAARIFSHGGAIVSPPTLQNPSGDRSKVYIEGWNAQAQVLAKPLIRSNRTLWTLPADPEQVTFVGSWTLGGNFLEIGDGVNNLVFQHLNTERFEHVYKFVNGAWSDGVEFHNLSFYNVRRFIDCGNGTVSGGGTTMEVTNVEISNITGVGFSKQGIRIRGNSHHWTLIDCDINSGRQASDNFANCYILEGSGSTAHDITYIRCIASNCHDVGTGPTDFWNGDGFSGELQNYNIVLIDCESYGHTDAGFDYKSTPLLMQGCIAADNKENYKLWKTTTVENCIGVAPSSRGGAGSPTNIEGAGTDPNLTFIGGSFTNGHKMRYAPNQSGVCRGIAVFRGTTFDGSGFYAGDSSGAVRGISVYDNTCVGMPVNHAAFTVPTFIVSAGGGRDNNVNIALPANEQGDVAVALIVADGTAGIIGEGNGGDTVVANGFAYFGPSVLLGTIAFDNQTGNFTNGLTITGAVSGATAVIVSQSDAGATGTLSLKDIVGQFQDNEIITDTSAGSALVNGALTNPFTARLAWKRLAGQTYQNVSLAATGGIAGFMRVAVVWIVAGCPLTGNPFEGYASNSGIGTTMTSPPTVVSGDSRAVYRVFCKGSSIARTATPAGYTQRVSFQTAFGATGGIYVDSKESVGASTEAASVSTIGASHQWISLTFAAKPLNPSTPLSPPAYSQGVAISGSTTPGATLTRVAGVADGNPTPTKTWVWQKFPGGVWTTVQTNGATYSATVAGDRVRIVETAANGQSPNAVSTSATQVIGDETAETASLLGYITSLTSTAAYTVGTQVEHSFSGSTTNICNQEFVDIESITGRFPSILAMPFSSPDCISAPGHTAVTPIGITRYNQIVDRIKAHFTAGGITTVNCHMGNPVTGDLKWVVNFTGAGSWTDRSGSPVNACLAGGSKRSQFLSWVDGIAQLCDDCEVGGIKVPLILRFFHEINGTWFWWNGLDRAVAMKQLWADFVNRIRVTNGINNVLFDLNFAYATSNPSWSSWYNAEYVDIVSLDIYNDSGVTPGASNRTSLIAAAPGKPFWFAEYGPKNDAGASANDVPAIWTNLNTQLKAISPVWGVSYWKNALGPQPNQTASNPGLVTQFNDAACITLDKLPDVYNDF